MTKPVKVLAGAPCSKVPVCNEFFDCWSRLDLPPGSLWRRVTGGNIPDNLNDIVQCAKDNDCTHVFIVENDSVFSPDTVTRLLAHDVPVVAGLCRQRDVPFNSYVYKGFDPVNGGLHWYKLQPGDKGLIGGKGWATGMGGILIRMDVFDQLEKPYFWHTYIGEKYYGQDILFGRSLMDAGIEVYCDTDVIIGHITECMIGSENDPVTGWNVVLKVHEATLKHPQP